MSGASFGVAATCCENFCDTCRDHEPAGGILRAAMKMRATAWCNISRNPAVLKAFLRMALQAAGPASGVVDQPMTRPEDQKRKFPEFCVLFVPISACNCSLGGGSRQIMCKPSKDDYHPWVESHSCDFHIIACGFIHRRVRDLRRRIFHHLCLLYPEN